jgi:hypothetical protein
MRGQHTQTHTYLQTHVRARTHTHAGVCREVLERLERIAAAEPRRGDFLERLRIMCGSDDQARENVQVLLQLASAAASCGIGNTRSSGANDAAAAAARLGGAPSVLRPAAPEAAQALVGMNYPSVSTVAANLSDVLRSAAASGPVEGGLQSLCSSSESASVQHGEVPWEHQESRSSDHASQPSSASPEHNPLSPIYAACGRANTTRRWNDRVGLLMALQNTLAGGHLVMRMGRLMTQRSIGGLLRGGTRVLRGSVSFGGGIARHSLGLGLATARALKLRPLLYMAAYRLVQTIFFIYVHLRT